MTESTSVSGSTSSRNNTAPHSSSKKWPVQFTISKFDKEFFEFLEIIKDETVYRVLPPRLGRKIVNLVFGNMSE